MILLCSQSPRRKQILENLGIPFYSYPITINEEAIEGEDPHSYLKRICQEKAREGGHQWNLQMVRQGKPEACFVESGNLLVLAGDTIVVWKGKILQKPQGWEDAVEMLKSLSGREHEVLSGIGFYFYQKGSETFIFESDSTRVFFHPWSRKEIESYLRKFQPFDKAGSYGIQDPGGPVSHWEGSYSNVMGFPTRKFLKHLGMVLDFAKEENGWDFEPNDTHP